MKKHKNPYLFSKKIMKVYITFSVAALLLLFGTVIASAAGFDSSGLKTGIQTGLTAVISITGGGIAVFGVVHLIEAQSSSDPNAKSAGVKQLASGLGLIIVGAILVPVFMNAITF